MIQRALAILLVIAGSAGSLSGQFAWYVDPVNGDDGDTGWNENDAFKTLTHALTRATITDTIFCMPGTYSAASGETFPIRVKNRVSLSGLGGAAVFDGNGAGVLFDLGANVTEPMTVSGLTFTDATTLFSIQAGRTVTGLLVQGCTFGDCTTGFAAECSTNAVDQDFELNACTFAALAGGTAVRVSVSDGKLEGGGLISNKILGDYATGIEVNASDDAVIGTGFRIERNRVAGCDDGILLTAAGSGGNGLNVATIEAPLIANSLDGSRGAGGVGLGLTAETGGLGENALVASAVSFCEIADFGVAVRASVDNDSNNLADVTSDFYGNVLRGDQTGVQLEAAQPNPQNRNADPNFGGHPDGGFSGLNTFLGFATDFDLTIAQSADPYACCCWFDGAPVSQEGTVLTNPVMNDPLEAAAQDSVRPGFEGEVVTLLADGRSGFVDAPVGGPTGQITVSLDGVELPQDALSAPQPGDRLEVTLPSLDSGTHVLTVANPGGQLGQFEFLAEASEDDSCFVATAAHGDAGAPEVLALRGLRDEYLKGNAAGRGFIRWYYREGPAAAAWISERPWARAGARLALQPAVLAARALTQWNPGQRFAFAVALLGGAFALLRRRFV